MRVEYLLWILILIAGLSPMLTFTRLWQIKEWRLDRLREHLRHEGMFGQLFGVVRPMVVALGIALMLSGSWFSIAINGYSLYDFAAWLVLGLLAWFTLFRFVIFRQARPVWTKKAILVFSLAMVFYAASALLLMRAADGTAAMIYSMLLPIFAFLFVFVSLLTVMPVDVMLKRRILSKAGKMRASHGRLLVVGITGSVGKTTTKELLLHILSDRKVLATPAHVNTEIGIARLMISSLREDHQIFIVEMGAYRKGEIATLCRVTRPQIGAITFVGSQHLGLFGSREELCHAKGELFRSLPPGGHGFLNADTEYCEHLMECASCPVHTVGTGGRASYEAFDIQEDAGGVAFSVRGTRFFVPVHGTHQVTNILLAIAMAETLGVPIVESAKRLKSFKGTPQTFEKKKGASGQVVLDDTHNASPASFRAAIEWAKMRTEKPKILVTAGMLELGKDERAIYREIGMLSRGVFDEVIFLNKKCVRSFEEGLGNLVTVTTGRKLNIDARDGMLIVCEGRVPASVMRLLLS